MASGKNSTLVAMKPSELVIIAIHSLGNKSGSSQDEIVKFISTQYGINEGYITPHVESALKRGINFGILSMENGLYGLEEVPQPPGGKSEAGNDNETNDNKSSNALNKKTALGLNSSNIEEFIENDIIQWKEEWLKKKKARQEGSGGMSNFGTGKPQAGNSKVGKSKPQMGKKQSCRPQAEKDQSAGSPVKNSRKDIKSNRQLGQQSTVATVMFTRMSRTKKAAGKSLRRCQNMQKGKRSAVASKSLNNKTCQKFAWKNGNQSKTKRSGTVRKSRCS